MAKTDMDSELVRDDGYKYGFVTDVEQELAPKGLNEDIIRFISEKKGEPEWMLDWRLKAYAWWQTKQEPTWALLDYPAIDYQDAHPADVPATWADIGKARELLGWSPQVSVEEGLRRSVEWYRENREAVLPLELGDR